MSSQERGVGGRRRTRRDPLLLTGVATQLAVALVVPMAPLAMYLIIDDAVDGARAAHPAETWFVDGYAGGALFTYGALALACTVYGLVLMVIAVRCLARATIGPAALVAPWPALGPVLCVGVANPATGFDFGEPDGYSLVGTDSVPEWTVPALAGWAALILALALVNTVLAVIRRARSGPR
jgi:hypothetical protein